jgi:hypothetical protein
MIWPTIFFWLICAAFVACGLWSVIRQSQRPTSEQQEHVPGEWQ